MVSKHLFLVTISTMGVLSGRCGSLLWSIWDCFSSSWLLNLSRHLNSHTHCNTAVLYLYGCTTAVVCYCVTVVCTCYDMNLRMLFISCFSVDVFIPCHVEYCHRKLVYVLFPPSICC